MHPYFCAHLKYILLDCHQPEMCCIHFKIFGYFSDWYCWHSLKKPSFFIFWLFPTSNWQHFGTYPKFVKAMNNPSPCSVNSLFPFSFPLPIHIQTALWALPNFSSSINNKVISGKHLKREFSGIYFSMLTLQFIKP